VTASATPYVRRYFNGRPIDTPEPSASPSVSPGASESPATGPTPYVRRYFNGRPIDTPAPNASASASALPSLGPTPYVRRYYQGKLIATPPPSPSPSVLPSASATATTTAAPTATTEPTTVPAPASPIPTIRRYFNGRPLDASSPAPSASPSPLTTVTPASGSDYLLGGTWRCTTFGGNALSHTFSRDEDATSLVVDTQVVLPNGRTAALHEKFLHHRSGTWTAQLANGTFIVSAPEWTGDTWRFVGFSTDGGKKVQAAMVFNRLDADVFTREFQRRQGTTWANYAGETCRRAAP